MAAQENTRSMTFGFAQKTKIIYKRISQKDLNTGI